MVTAIISHEVKNYSDWRKIFDGDEVNRAKAGLKITGVYQSVENPNMLTMIGEAPSVEVAAAYMQKPELKAAMEMAGVISMPEVKFLKKS